MSLNNKVACPMDCYDACQAEIIDENIKGSKEHETTNGKLCINFANLLKKENLKNAIFEGKQILLKESLDILIDKLKNTKPEKILFYKGSGNIGVMQNATKNFFTQYGSTLTKGSLCDGGGGAGIEAGRGNVINPPIQKLINADIIIVWGRNFSVTSSHLYNLVKDKIFVTIDPICTDIAKKSKIHMQINPKTDHELALLFTRFAYMQDLEDSEFIEEFGSGADWFFDVARNRPIVSYEATTGVPLTLVNDFFDLIEGKSVAIMLGLGVQKYFEGAQITRCIDSFAAYMGYHKKEAGGVWYLSDSAFGYNNQFEVKAKNKKVSIPSVDFGSFDLVFIQGSNPVVSAPNTQKIIDGLKKTFVVYFGTTLNETCEYADLIIPSCSFLSKEDVRLSYGHELKSISQAVKLKDENTISEYEMASFLIEEFNLEKLKTQDEIISYYENHKPILKDFDTFEFIEDMEIEPLYKEKKANNFYYITGKNKNSLNSQFAKDDFVYLHSSTNFKNDDVVKISSKYGNANFIVKIDDNIKSNCAFFFTGNKYANYLTPALEDEISNSAMYQEVLVQIELS
ncbi:MAG: molybdopterin-dependent oxidoreductase [Aliarcobacter sp.]|nr:molybdopterin-dependent oxidoreductase [Aliarcobacter sp.]